jgi:hypothetical protein
MSLRRMMTPSEKAIQKPMTGPRRLVHQSIVGAAEDQHLSQLLEDRSVRYAGAVVVKWIIHPTRGQQYDKLLPDALDDVCGRARARADSFVGKYEQLPR